VVAHIGNVKNKLTIVANALHFGEMFDSEVVQKNLFAFLKENLKQ
jgi:hypothetical protein